MIPSACVEADAPSDWAGWFDPPTEDALNRVALQFCKNGVEYARSCRYAFDEVFAGDWFEDLSE